MRNEANCHLESWQNDVESVHRAIPALVGGCGVCTAFPQSLWMYPGGNNSVPTPHRSMKSRQWQLKIRIVCTEKHTWSLEKGDRPDEQDTLTYGIQYTKGTWKFGMLQSLDLLHSVGSLPICLPYYT
jgi:hypothetical protein